MQLNLSTNEIDRVRIKLRGDVIVRPLPTSDGISYQLEDPVAVKFYRVGRPEYVLISLLDGRTSLAEAITASARVLGDEAFTDSEVTSICLWLIETGLAVPTQGSISVSPADRPAPIQSYFNPFWMKLPVLQPESLLDWLLPWTRWFFTAPALLVMIVFWVFGAFSITTHIDQFRADSRQVFSPHNWVMLAIVWIVLKLAHEFGHALCCRRYGGRVTQFGVVFILLAPMAFVDVTSSLGMSSRGRRMHIAAAGMLVEISIASLAALCWSNAESPFLRHLLHNVIISASFTTIVFNINPLMRFDGYFLFEDLFNLSNLGSTAQRWIRSILSRFFFGSAHNVTLPTGVNGWVIRTYALLASMWRVVVTSSLLTAAAVMFQGAGLVLALGALLVWLIKPLIELAHGLSTRWRRNRPTVYRAMILGTVSMSLVGALIFALPSPFQRHAPGIVEFADLYTVRITSAGFVETISVQDGDLVSQGDELIRLRNDEVEARVNDLKLVIEQSEARRIGLVNRRELVLAQIEQRQQQAYLEQLAELQFRLDSLTVRAPAAGRVMARHLDHQNGNYLNEGAELLVIGNDSRKEIVASVDQRDVEAFMASDQTSATHLLIDGGPDAVSSDVHIEPRASTTLPHPALSAAHGGSVDVVDAEGDASNNSPVRLAEPRFLLRVALDQDTSQRLFAGQAASVVPLQARRTIAEQVVSAFRDWGRALLDPQ